MPTTSPADDFHSHWQQWLPSFEQRLDITLQAKLAADIDSAGLKQLSEAMRYSSLAGGKRMRALLVYLVSDCCSKQSELNLSDRDHSLNDSKHTREALVERAAIAIELIHAYSLIHDDLPAMDDDDLRRGQPTCHIKYGEAVAILSGDALQALAFECLSEPLSTETIATQLALVSSLASASGALGMVGGQAIDLDSENKQLQLDELSTLHRLKTGKLIQAAVMMGAQCFGASNSQVASMMDYGENIGLAFQVRDDIIDITSSSEQLGKPQGTDIEANKSTYPSLLGMQGASQKANEYYQNAIAALEQFGPEADLLRGLASFFVHRNS